MAQHFVYLHEHPLNPQMAPKLPEGMPEDFGLYHWFAKQYNYTPEQVDNLPLDWVEWYFMTEEALMHAQDELSERSQNQ